MKNKEVVKRVYSYVQRYRAYLFSSLLLAVISVAGTLYIPVLVGRAIDNIVGKNSVDFISLADIVVRIAVIIGITALSQWTMNACNNKITFNVIRDMRSRAFSKIETIPIKYLDSHPVR